MLRFTKYKAHLTRVGALLSLDGIMNTIDFLTPCVYKNIIY